MPSNPLIAPDETLDRAVSGESGRPGRDGGVGDGLYAEQDKAVKVTDFASGSGSQSPKQSNSPPTPPIRVDTPTDKQAWDAFMERYSAGAAQNNQYPIPRTGSATPHAQRHSPTPSSSTLPNRNDGSPYGSWSRNLSGVNTPSNLDGDGQGGIVDQNRVVSSSGQVNQDPNIPNISPSDLDELSPHRGSKTIKRNLEPQQSLTREHMGQFAHEQQQHASDQAEADDAEGAEADREEGTAKPSSSSRSKRKRPRKVMDAELGSQRAAHSITSSSSSSSDREIGEAEPEAESSRPSRPKLKSKPSHRSTTSRQSEPMPFDSILAESATGSSAAASLPDLNFDTALDRDRVRQFFNKHGYMPAPKQAPDALRRRLRVIRRLGLEETPDDLHKTTLDRFTRLAVSIFKTKRALVSIVGRERQIFLSEIGMGADSTSFEDAFCCHTIIGTGENCMVVPDASKDWRFAKNPLVKEGKGIIQFYAGAPLKVGKGPKAAIIGSMCIIDDKPRHDFDEEGKRLLNDLAECAVSELELLYNQQATVEAAKLHQISVDFLRRSLKHRPAERAGQSRPSRDGFTGTTTTSTNDSSSNGKRNSGADEKQSEDDIDIFDEACQVIRLALEAHAVAIVDLTQFHMFYPSYQTSTTGGSASGPRSVAPSARASGPNPLSGPSSGSYTSSSKSRSGEGGEDAEPYQRAADGKAARKTYSVVDPMSAGRTPQVLFVPAAGTATGRTSDRVPSKAQENTLPILGYSSDHDNFAFNFSSTPAGRKIVCDFIARNVKGRTVWYSRDDSEGIAESITHLMPPGTEASLAMPVFGYDGQVAFAVVGCWTDPLFTYPAGALQFVETIAGSLLASVMKERLHQAERAQLNFAAAASHELRTPLHQLNAAAGLLRQSLQSSLTASPSNSKQSSPIISNGDKSPTTQLSKSSLARQEADRTRRDDRVEAAAHLEVIESNGVALGEILENIIDTLDIGRAVSTGRPNGANQTAVPLPSVPEQMCNLSDVLEDVVKEAILQESKARRVSGEKGLEDVEILLEVMPRLRGRWILATDPGPLSRALSKIVSNACKFTEKGYIHISVQDMSRDVALPGGYDNSIQLSHIVFDIKDTGKGMSPDFLDEAILRPFAKADPFMPGAGLGLNLAQRMIQILGGRIAIKSTLGKGTLVHIELPLHLLSNDNDLDVDEQGIQYDNFDGRTSSPVRQDGILLKGFDNGDAGIRRVGRTLLRQLKLRFCRVVDDPLYASLIVVPEGRFTQEELRETVLAARPDVEVISLLSPRQAMETGHTLSTPSMFSSSNKSSSEPNSIEDSIRITYMKRPLYPSLIRRIVRPPKRARQPNEVYISEVTGGDEAREERNAQVDEEIVGEDEFFPTIHPTLSSNGSVLRGSIVLSDGWSNSSGTGSMGSTSKRERRSRDNTVDGNLHPTSPEGIIKDLVVSPPSGRNRPPLDTHVSDLTPISDSLSRMSLQSLQSDASLATSMGGDEDSTAMKVLVVEDNAVNRRIVVAMLKRTACRYAEAVDGEDAVRKFLVFEPDLVLLDINMPIKDGFQAATEMRTIESKRAGTKRSKIIAVTALSQEQSKRKGMLECGIDEWRTKPVSLKTLRDDVERMRE